jgi:GT2 family glycosyltransferase
LWGTRLLVDNPNGTVEVEAVSGACQMIRRDVFQRAGLYSTVYFMYAEDIDLCRKVAELGLANYYIGDAVVMHHGGQSSGGDSENGRVAVMMRDSWRKYFELHRGAGYATTFRVVVALQAVCRLALIATALLACYQGERRHRLMLARKKWGSVLRWAVGLESWVADIGAKEPCIHLS